MRTLQPGIYYDHGERPLEAFGILFLRTEQDAEAAAVGTVLRELWATYGRLAAGDVDDLPGHPVEPAGLTALVAYGVKAFALPGARLPVPQCLGDQFRFRSPLANGGGPLLRASGLRYAPTVAHNPATEEVAVQLIAGTELAVHRAVVETWRVLQRHVDPATGMGPLEMVSFFRGFQRDDGRSWIGFHDGVSNLLAGDDRAAAITIKPENAPVAEDEWTVGGTYLAFLRLAVDLTVWDAIDVPTQELIVGRSKLTGAPLVSIDAGGVAVPVGGCPVTGTRTVVERGNETFREPEAVTDPVLRASHVQRANQHRKPSGQPNSLRMYRQGYEFLDVVGGELVAGLNFVSFQDTPERLTRTLTQDGWLGGTNFGGPVPGGLSPELISVLAGGVYVVPPAATDGSLPGGSLVP